MTQTKFMKYAKSSLLVSVTVTGLGFGVVTASSVENDVSPKEAAKAEQKASVALAAKKYDAAIAYGEKAVLGAPHNADYRLLLGQANLSAGRFASAETLFGDVLTLDPSNARAALNMALTQIALDHAADARNTLDVHREHLSSQDYGLALALAGNPTDGVKALEFAARSDSATAKTRQNLALAYALAGRWDEAKTTASQDLSPDLVDKRMTEWASMAHPQAAWEQVATLLHVKPVNDPGLPYQLALRPQPEAPALAAAAPVPVPAPAPMVAPPAPEAPQPAVARFETASSTPATAFAAPSPVVQSVPVAQAAPTPVIHAEAGPAKRVVAQRVHVQAPKLASAVAHPMAHPVAHQPFQRGKFAVQIGAFADVRQARAVWARDVRKVALLRSYDPAQSQFKLHSTSYYRLAVTGFSSHAEAAQVCAKLRAAGSGCFVRTVMGDQLASWLHHGAQEHLASHKAVVAPAKGIAARKPDAGFAHAIEAAKAKARAVKATASVKIPVAPKQQVASR